ncbi:hypothetical protein SAMN05444280_1626 [Tangfeifania diversioriginum]|uniref:Uncharacterized protein n=1 Tax=Tangfeifania diversioriginum TaxID=1168035 RepID=A0A1M6PJY2_9BACT|nr:hypothetical protein SAMN05444280_1626 [Tangfeifania diversioriginum]
MSLKLVRGVLKIREITLDRVAGKGIITDIAFNSVQNSIPFHVWILCENGD